VTHFAPDYFSKARLAAPRLVVGVGSCNVPECKVDPAVYS